MRNQNSVKGEKGVKRVSLEVVNEIPTHKPIGNFECFLQFVFSNLIVNSTGRTSTLNKPMFHMGSSFDDKSDDESVFEVNGASNNNNTANVKDENIPLVPRK